jgi:hypothetical protein
MACGCFGPGGKRWHLVVPAERVPQITADERGSGLRQEKKLPSGFKHVRF